MTLLFIIFSIIIAVYAVLIIGAALEWIKIQEHRNIDGSFPNIKISVIIPARNEEKKIRDCLESIFNQKYPSEFFEVIVADDHSTDGTAEIVEKVKLNQSNLHLIRISEETMFPKKRAIAEAIAASKGHLIVTTDADCIVSPCWLQSIADFYRNNNFKMICGPVLMAPAKSFLEYFQQLEMFALMGVTAVFNHKGNPIMCNGANLIYEKQSFVDAKGFESIDNKASGDDVLLMLKFKKLYGSGAIGFLKDKDAIVTTFPEKRFTDFINQRIRWSTKTGQYPDKAVFFTSLFIFITCLSLLIALVVSLFSSKFAAFAAIIFLVKVLADIFFITKVSDFFNIKPSFSVLILGQLFNVIYVPFVAIYSRFVVDYTWKSRRLR
jgi:glycosyltransferase involved in cell wall biosynthesis